MVHQSKWAINLLASQIVRVYFGKDDHRDACPFSEDSIGMLPIKQTVLRELSSNIEQTISIHVRKVNTLVNTKLQII